MKITVQYFEDCPNWRILDERVRELTAGRDDVSLSLQRVVTEEEAERIGFLGSPTLIVDGVDPFAQPGRPTGLTCRVYETPDGPAGAPSVSQLTDALLVRGALRG
jgi:hypothetical protein